MILRARRYPRRTCVRLKQAAPDLKEWHARRRVSEAETVRKAGRKGKEWTLYEQGGEEQGEGVVRCNGRLVAQCGG